MRSFATIWRAVKAATTKEDIAALPAHVLTEWATDIEVELATETDGKAPDGAVGHG